MCSLLKWDLAFGRRYLEQVFFDAGISVNGRPKRVFVWGGEGAHYPHIQILMSSKASHVGHVSCLVRPKARREGPGGLPLG